MRYAFLFVFYSIALIAQDLPISESSAFLYNKSNYGSDFFNITVVEETLNDGAVIVQPYSDSYIKLGNYSSNYLFKRKDGIYPYIRNTFQNKDTTWLVEENKINLLLKNKLKQTILIAGKKEKTFNHLYYNNTICYIKRNDFNNKMRACVFSPTNIKILKKVENASFMQFLIHEKKLKLILQYYDTKVLEIFDVVNNKLVKEKTISFDLLINKIDSLTNLEQFLFYSDYCLYKYNLNKIELIKNFNSYRNYRDYKDFYIISNGPIGSIFSKKNLDFQLLANTTINNMINTINYSKPSNSYYCGTNVGLFRLFPHLKKYPRLFNNSNSNSVFALIQDKSNKIYAGSYSGFLSIINNNQSKSQEFPMLLNAMNYKGKPLLFVENNNGVIEMNNFKVVTKIVDSIPVFYGYASKKKMFLGTAANGMWYKSNIDVFNKKIKWNKINEKNGYELLNTLSISEDKNGLIWSGSGNGIAFYNPKTNKATTWTIDKKQIPFRGSMTLLTDDNETLWIGTLTGELYYFDGKDYQPKNIIKINHPLLESKNVITFIHQWKDYLVLGAKDKILLFDLKQWNKNKSIRVKYLNPIESNFTNTTEQNTVFTDIRDESIWFATSDMVYQFDVKKWLSLPNFVAKPTLTITNGAFSKDYNDTKTIHFKPLENSFDIRINYQTPDNLPRLINGTLVKKGERPIYNYPNLDNNFHFANLSSGEYYFYARICQQDGTYTIHKYTICIAKFFYQEWWFWLLIGLFFVAILSYFFSQRIANEKTKKKMSQLNLSSLSNQFRPHFMLNALNSIASQLEDLPHAEKIIYRLGDSINILYGFSQKNEFTHLFVNEWKLTENIIEILKTIYIPNLEIKITGLEVIDKNYKIPVGLIQIPVENALLHGLRNLEGGECLLAISFSDIENYYCITITDNGIGRQKSKTINSFKKNGNGLNTINQMIAIINNFNEKSIYFEIIDQEIGTKIAIKLKKQITYEQITL